MDLSGAPAGVYFYYNPGSYDPFQGTATGYNPQYANTAVTAANGASTAAYQQGMLQYNNDQLAFQKAQAAYTDVMQMGSAYGFMPGAQSGGYFNFGQMPVDPSLSQVGAHTNASGTFQPTSWTGTPTLQEQAQQYQQLQGQATNTAGETGLYQQPIPEQWTQQMPTWDQIQSYMQSVNPSWNADTAKAMLTKLVNETPDTFHGNYSLSNLTQADLQNVIQAGGGMPSQATLQMQSMYGGYGTPQQGQETMAQASQAQQLAANQAALTGYYNQPSSMYAPGTYIQDPTSQAYYQVSAQGQLTPVSGLPQGATAVQGTQGIGATAGQQGQSTLAAQQQQFSQGLQTAQFGLSVQQQQQQAAQQYLSLLSSLQGPADYGKYLNVLGSTPQGLQGMVSAAAGNYIPGGGTTGVAPQAQTLQNLVGAATGYGAGGTGANASTTPAQSQQGAGGTSGTASPGGMNYQNYLATAQGLPAPNQIAPQSFNYMTPSQQKMLGGMYSNLGYDTASGDVNALYQQSLPKYAAGSAAGNMRLV